MSQPKLTIGLIKTTEAQFNSLLIYHFRDKPFQEYMDEYVKHDWNSKFIYVTEYADELDLAREYVRNYNNR